MTDTDKDKTIALLRDEVKAWRNYEPVLATGVEQPWPPTVYGVLARAVVATDAAGALEDK